MIISGRPYAVYLVFTVALALNFSFWLHSKKVHEVWGNVPQAPNGRQLSMMALGDDQVAYRMTGYFLQNLGSAGGATQPLKDYNYGLLEKWLFAANDLDPASNYLPYMAAYYFVATQDKEQTRYLIPYLDMNGQGREKEKWRWSAQAAYIAQFVLEDKPLALEIANRLSTRQEAANWAKQLPALISLDMGDKKNAYAILLAMLDEGRDTLDPAEINAILHIICTRTLARDEAAQNPLCRDYK